MSKPKVRFILESYASKSDVNGNRYWYHVLTSTKTGVSVRFEACHESNARTIVDKATGARCFPEVHQITVTEVPIRRHTRQWKSCPFNEANHEALYAAIREIEE